MKKSKNSTLLRQISQLEAEVTQLRALLFNNMELGIHLRKKSEELEAQEKYKDKYLQMLYGHKKLQEACGFAVQSPEECRVIKRISRRKMRRESKKVISEGLIDHELVTSMMMEETALDNIYAESLRDFMESETYREWEREDELKERYADLAYPDDVTDYSIYFEGDYIDDGGPYYGT